MKHLIYWITGLAFVFVGCIQTPDADDGDAGPPADAGVDDGRARAARGAFAHAFVHPTCGYDGEPSIILTLAQHVACDLSADGPERVQIYLNENADLTFPIAVSTPVQIAPGSPMSGVYFDANGDGESITGTLTFDAFDMFGAVAGRYVLRTADGAALEGHFGARVCPAESAVFDPAPDCYPYVPEPPIEPGPRNSLFSGAFVQPVCGPGIPSIIVSLGGHAACDLEADGPDRLQLYFDANAALRFPIRAPVALPVAPATPMHGLYFDEQGIASQVSGELRIERFDIGGQVYAQYDLRTADGLALADAVEAEVCISNDAWDRSGSDCYPYGPGGPPGPRPDPAPEPPGPSPEPGPDVAPEPEPQPAGPIPPVEPGDHCEGHYTVTQWAITDINFQPQYINDMLSLGLIGGSLVMDVVVRANTVELIDVLVAPGGVRARAPETPAFAAMPIAWRADGFDTQGESVFGVWLSESQYQPFEPLVWRLEGTALDVDVDGDCERLSIIHTGWFTDLGYSLGGQDFDEDGDGTPDGWLLTSQMTAERL